MPLDVLSVIVGALAGTVATVAIPRVIHHEPHDSAHTLAEREFECIGCNQVFPSRKRGRTHLRDVHNAPGGRRELNLLLTETKT